jgi:hypothetical protein
MRQQDKPNVLQDNTKVEHNHDGQQQKSTAVMLTNVSTFPSIAIAHALAVLLTHVSTFPSHEPLRLRKMLTCVSKTTRRCSMQPTAVLLTDVSKTSPVRQQDNPKTHLCLCFAPLHLCVKPTPPLFLLPLL